MRAQQPSLSQTQSFARTQIPNSKQLGEQILILLKMTVSKLWKLMEINYFQVMKWSIILVKRNDNFHIDCSKKALDIAGLTHYVVLCPQFPIYIGKNVSWRQPGTSDVLPQLLCVRHIRTIAPSGEAWSPWHRKASERALWLPATTFPFYDVCCHMHLLRGSFLQLSQKEEEIKSKILFTRPSTPT